MRWVFETFEIDLAAGRLVRAGEAIALERRALDLLCYLAQHPGRLLQKEELLEKVWNAQALSDGVVSNAIAKLRKALGQDPGARTPIETVHGRGYLFHALGALQPPSAANASPTPYVGRAASLTQLDDSLERALGSAGQLVLISGEAGIGKSRTLEQLCLGARARGFSVWVGGAYADAAPAYWPWVEIARAGLEQPGSGAHVPEDAWALATLIPERLRPSRSSDSTADLRFRLFDEWSRWLGAASTETPRLIAIEDLHQADAGSLELLGHLARSLAQRRVVLAATLRDHDDDASSASLQRLWRLATHVPLHGLTLPELAALVRGLAPDRTPEDGALELLHARTQGNPFFVRQLVLLFAQRGQALTRANLESAELPPAIREVIRQRLDALSGETRTLLAAAALIGSTFDAARLAQLLEQSVERVLVALEHAQRLGITRERAREPLQFEFQHALVREGLYAELALTRRGELHGRLARALADSAAGDARSLGELARHSLSAAPFELELCVRHCERAADAAREASGFEAAATLLQRALDRLAAEGGQGVRRCELSYQLGLDQFCAGETQTAWRTLEQGASLAREVGASHWQARFVSRLANWHELGDPERDLGRAIDEALTALDDEATDLRAILLARKAELGTTLGAVQRQALQCEAERLAAHGGKPAVLLEVAIAGVGQRDPSRIDQTRRAVATYRVLDARHRGVVPGVLERLRRFALELSEYQCALIAGDLVAADLALLACDAVAQTSRVAHIQHAVALMRAGRALGDGRLDDVTQVLECLHPSSPVSERFGLVWVFYSLLLVDARNERAVLSDIFAKADASALERIALHQRTAVLASLASLAAKAGEHALSRSLLGRIPAAELSCMPARHGDLGLMCCLAEAYWELGERERAEPLYARLAPHAACNALGVAYEYKGAVAHYLGMLALLLGDSAGALLQLGAAEAINQALGMPLQLARTRELLAHATSVG